jgi:hypothetical protein
MCYSQSSVIELLQTGGLQLWCANDEEEFLGVMVTEFRQYPLMKLANFALISGKDMHRWLHHLETVELWARSQGAQFMTGEGRVGWLRVLAPLGYEQEGVCFAKNLEMMTLN